MFLRAGWALAPALLLGWLAAAGAARAADQAAPVIDRADFFSSEAINKAIGIIKGMQRRDDRDLIIETFASVPSADQEKVKKLTGKENEAARAEYFSEWAKKRYKERKVKGVYVLICKSPVTALQVAVGPRTQKAFGAGESRKLRQILIENFRKKDYDKGLLAGVEYVRDTLDAKGEEKKTNNPKDKAGSGGGRVPGPPALQE